MYALFELAEVWQSGATDALVLHTGGDSQQSM